MENKKEMKMKIVKCTYVMVLINNHHDQPMVIEEWFNSTLLSILRHCHSYGILS